MALPDTTTLDIPTRGGSVTVLYDQDAGPATSLQTLDFPTRGASLRVLAGTDARYSASDLLASADDETALLVPEATDANAVLDAFTGTLLPIVADLLGLGDDGSSALVPTAGDSVLPADLFGGTLLPALADTNAVLDAYSAILAPLSADLLALLDAQVALLLPTAADSGRPADLFGGTLLPGPGDVGTAQDAFSGTLLPAALDLLAALDAQASLLLPTGADTVAPRDAQTALLAPVALDTLAARDSLSGTLLAALADLLAVKDALTTNAGGLTSVVVGDTVVPKDALLAYLMGYVLWRMALAVAPRGGTYAAISRPIYACAPRAATYFVQHVPPPTRGGPMAIIAQPVGTTDSPYLGSREKNIAFTFDWTKALLGSVPPEALVSASFVVQQSTDAGITWTDVTVAMLQSSSIDTAKNQATAYVGNANAVVGTLYGVICIVVTNSSPPRTLESVTPNISCTR